MKILIDINHPGHVHYFKNVIKHLQNNNHDIIITARDRQFVKELLDSLELPFVNRGKGKNSKFGKLIYMFRADITLVKVALKYKPDLFLSFASTYASHASFVLRKKHIALTDTEHADKIHSIFTYPFCSSILTPASYLNDLGTKHIRFNNVIEGLYLHENYFTPDHTIRKELNLNEEEEYILIRFVSWNAHHDFGQSGLDLETKRTLINILKTKYKVLISSEGNLPKEFENYEIKISPEKMHDVLANASLFIGESATMASESVLLGTNAVYINSLPLMGYLKLEEENKLLKYFKNSTGVVDYVKGIIKDPNLKINSIKKTKEFQKDFIDPTKFLAWFIENYPNSIKVIKDNPDFQYKFI